MKAFTFAFACAAIAACPFAHSQNTGVGRLKGSFAVSQTGLATYSIPLWIPPGARGMQPKLSLNYNSAGPDDILGPGWSLGGLSTITRCNKTYAQDTTPSSVTLTTTDAFCMDGKRLRVTSGVSTYGADGSTYQTEIADFSQITFHAPTAATSYFEVQRKDGTTWEYGNTTNSRDIIPGTTVPVLWGLDKVSDRQLNNWIVTYTQTYGTIVPASIQYTQTSTNSTYDYEVSFVYGIPRAPTDIPIGYVAGAQVENTYQLTNINVTSSGTNVRNYNLTYVASGTTARNRLTAIQECGGTGGTDCFPQTAITYQNGTAGYASLATASGSGPTSNIANSADFNGDGQMDLIFAVTSGTTNHWYVQFATSTGFGAPVDTTLITNTTDPVLLDDFLAEGQTDILAIQSGVWHVFRWNGTAFVNTSTGLADSNRQTASPYSVNSIVSADVDGDGRPDLVWEGADLKLYVRLNTSSSGTVSFSSTAYNVSGSTTYEGYLFGNNGFPNSTVKHMDFDGDGREDVVYSYSTAYGSVVAELLMRGTSSVVWGNGLPGNTYVPVNWNNDACTDLASPLATYISQCNGTTAATVIGCWNDGTPTFAAVDWDGDGRTDLVAVMTSGALAVCQSTSSGYTLLSTTLTVPATTTSFVAFDKNGDGLDDLAYLNPSSSYAIDYGLHSGANVLPDLATSITDGFGFNVTLTYTSIVNSGIYWKNTGAIYPEMDYEGPLNVVSEVQTSDGVGGTFIDYLYYQFARFNVQGRGFEGFANKINWDSRNAVYDWMVFQQPFPTTGGLAQENLLQPNDATIIRTTQNNWTCVPVTNPNCNVLDPTANNERYFPNVGSAVVTDYEVSGTLDGKMITQTTTTNTYDNYGNATEVVIATEDVDSTTPSPFDGQTWTSTFSQTISPQTGTWCLGLPTQITVQKTEPSGTTLTRTTQFPNPDYSNCRITGSIVEPTIQALTTTTVYGFDLCGNTSSVSVTGTGVNGSAMPTRQTSYNYSLTTDRCQFPEQVTNALGQTTTVAYDYNKGVPLSSTDPNNLVTSWTYDDFGRKTLEQRPDGTETAWARYLCASCYGDSAFYVQQTEEDSTGSHNPYWYRSKYFDFYDRLVYDVHETSNASSAAVSYQYDQLGRLTGNTNPNGNGFSAYWTTYTYDLLNRTLSAYRDINSKSSTLQYTNYTYQGRTSTVEDPKGNTTTRIADVIGELRTLKDPSGSATTYSYDPFSNVTSITDPNGNLTSRTYDVRGHLLTSSDPDRGAWTFEPDSLGEQTNVRDAKTAAPNWTRTYSFDQLGRVASRVESEGTTNWTWGTVAANHEIGRLKELAGLGDTENYTYDSDGRLSTHSMTWSGVSYTVSYNYNTIGKLNELIYPLASGQTNPFAVLYGYSQGYLSSVQNYTGGTAGTTFWKLTPGVANMDDWGHIVDETLGTTTAVRIQSAFDPLTGWLTTRQVGSGGATYNLQDLAYQWDLNGNLSQREDLNNSLTEGFVNDSLNRLQTSTLNGTQNLAVAFDPTGDISSRTEAGNTYTYAYDPTHVHGVSTVTQGSNVASYKYDANGNMTTWAGNAVTYSTYNMPTTINGSGVSSTFNYGPDRQRKQLTATYTADGDPGTETTVYVFGLYEHEVTPYQTHNKYFVQIPGGTRVVFDIASVSGTETTYLTSDHLGSAGLFLNASGVAQITESYSAYGYRRSSNWAAPLSPSASDYTTIAQVTRRGYSDAFHEMLDNLNLIHMNGRVYDPTIGRFLSPDPVVVRIGDSQGGNPYSYVENDPLSATDPSGFMVNCISMPGAPHGQACFSNAGALSDAPPNGGGASNVPDYVYENYNFGDSPAGWKPCPICAPINVNVDSSGNVVEDSYTKTASSTNSRSDSSAQSQDSSQNQNLSAAAGAATTASDTLGEIVVSGSRAAAVGFATVGTFVLGVLWPSNTAFNDTTMSAEQKPPSKSRQSKPKNAPPGTRPIDQSGNSHDWIEGTKDAVGAGPADWVGVAPNGDIITTNPDGTAENHGPSTEPN